MHRVVRVLITATFVVACLGLWFLVTITALLYPPTLYHGDYPKFTQWMLQSRPLLFAAAAAAVGYCAFSFRRSSADTNILLGAVLALVISIFFLAIAFTILLPWIPHT